MKEYFEKILDYSKGLIILLFETISYIYRGSVKFTLTFDQMVLIGVNSLPVVLLTIGFTGMVISLQTAHIVVKYGAGSAVGAGVAIILARELAPVLTGIVVAGRAGSAICAEISSMKVTEQIDALKTMAVSPLEYLVVPRFLASIIMLPTLTILANVVGFFGGYLVAVYFVDINPVSYYTSGINFLMLSDVIYGLIKSIVFGIIISLVACYQGIITEGGAVGVGKSTTNSVVISTLLIFAANYFLSMVMF